MSHRPCCWGILAGGSGRRVGGREKAWLHRGGRPQIVQLIEALRDAERRAGFQPMPLMISANRRLDEYRHFTDFVFPDAPGIGADPGPLAGLARLLDAVPVRHDLLVVAVDIGVDAALVEALDRLLDEEPEAITVIEDPGGRQPLLARYRYGLAGSCVQALAAGARAVRDWQDSHSARVLRIGQPLFNANRPDDYDPVDD